MKIRSFSLFCFFMIVLVFTASAFKPGSDSNELPAFGKDTVLVWKIENQGYSASFVVRIAQFLPDRFLEWEDEQTQGTIFMPNHDILTARGFVNSGFFKSGSETKGNKATTLWLSQRIYRELKDNKKAKCMLDGVSGSLKNIGEDRLAVQVNRSTMTLPVIKITDDRGSERWFLDQEDNPLMLNHKLRNFSQTLASITTDKSNTLRWIKGRKLANPAGKY